MAFKTPRHGQSVLPVSSCATGQSRRHRPMLDSPNYFRTLCQSSTGTSAITCSESTTVRSSCICGQPSHTELQSQHQKAYEAAHWLPVGTHQSSACEPGGQILQWPRGRGSRDSIAPERHRDQIQLGRFTYLAIVHRDTVRPLPSSIDPSNKSLWSLSFASAFSGKKIVTVPNTDKYITPSSMLASGHFSNNQAGQLKVLVVLTSTQVIDRQEPVTPLRPDEYSTPIKENRKRRIKQEGKTPSLVHKKWIKQEKDVERGNETKRDEIKQEIHVKMEQYDPDTDTFSPGLTCNELDVEELGEMEHSPSDLVSNSIDDGIRNEDDAEQEAGQEGEYEDESKNALELVRSQADSAKLKTDLIRCAYRQQASMSPLVELK